MASQKARDLLLREQVANGHWEGQLSASALSTATAISALSFYQSSDACETELVKQIDTQVDAGLAWLKLQQNEDGGWGDTGLNYSNISTSMLVVAALHASNRTAEFKDSIKKAESYIESEGGIEGLRRRYGKDKTFAVPILANCAMAGLVPWKEVATLPFFAACVPRRFYSMIQLPVVSYAVPALVAIGQAKFILDPPRNPISRTILKCFVKPSLKVLEKMLPASGGFLEAVPLTSFVSMALIKTDRASHEVAQKGVQFLLNSFRSEGGNLGSWPIDTNLATWNTTLAINALANHPESFAEVYSANPRQWTSCVDWVLSCQNRETHPFTGAAPGGWGWTDLSGAVPDADDSPGALLALKKIRLLRAVTGNDENSRDSEVQRAAELGIDWLIKLQNTDKGWPTFCRGWLKLPFDRSGTDLTAHVIRSFVAWRDEISDSKSRKTKVSRAIETGFDYLKQHQEKDGSWLPLWFGNQDMPEDINPFYGTAKVLMAYRDANLFDTKEAQFGLRWLRDNQNDDGGWGGGPSISWQNPVLGKSSVEETALCTEIMLDDPNPESQNAAQNGVRWLLEATESNLITEAWPIGFYFAKLWYFEKLYPLIFATSTLNRALRFQEDNESSKT
ncbi:MAG: prenyltransferase/squalene oxidase repeat-containing protein [Mariniblastus sp.]